MQYNQPFDQPNLPSAAFVNGNPGTGVAGSIPPAAQMEYPQREVVNALQMASLTPTNGDLTQLAQGMSIGLWLGAMGGSANALADVLPTLATTSDGVTQYAIPGLIAGMTFHGIIPATNTGTATLTLTGFGTAPGAKPIVRKDGTPVQAGDLPAGAIVSWRWDGASYRIVSMVQSDVLALIAANPTLITNIVQQSPLAGSRAVVAITSTSTFTVPANVYFLKRVTVWGAGGGGGGSYGSNGAGSGGGGGGYSQTFNIPVTPGQQIAATIGAGGAAGTGSPTSGGAGGITSFGSYLYAGGGGSGVLGNAGAQGSNSGSPGTGGGGTINLSASQGGGLALVLTPVIGGCGGGSPFGGPATSIAIGIGAPGNFPGGGGSGGQGGNAGGAGSAGLIIVEF